MPHNSCDFSFSLFTPFHEFRPLTRTTTAQIWISKLRSKNFRDGGNERISSGVFIFPNFNPTLHISNCACFFQISNIRNLILIFYLKRKEIVLELVMHSTLSHFGNFVFVQNEFEIRICIMGLDGDFTGRSDFTVETVLHANTCLFICLLFTSWP